jgi:hypothetical protein
MITFPSSAWANLFPRRQRDLTRIALMMRSLRESSCQVAAQIRTDDEALATRQQGPGTLSSMIDSGTFPSVMCLDCSG